MQQWTLHLKAISSFPKQKYTESLYADARSWYIDQAAIIGGHDQYSLNGIMWITDLVNFSCVTYIDTANYFIVGQSPFCTMKDFKNYQGLKSYDCFVSLRVRTVQTYKYICCETVNGVIWSTR